jgi:hypothetical protein
MTLFAAHAAGAAAVETVFPTIKDAARTAPRIGAVIDVKPSSERRT